MPVIKANELKVKRQLGSDIAIPQDRYILRLVEEKFEISKSSSNPMIVEQWQIVGYQNPDKTLSQTIKIGDAEVEIAGQDCNLRYLSLRSVDAAKNDGLIQRYINERAKLGISIDEVDTDNPKLYLKESLDNGKPVIVSAILSPEERVARKDLTPEQRAKGQKMGDAIKDENGKEIKRYAVAIRDVLGLSNVEVNQPY